jgi:NAD kinase
MVLSLKSRLRVNVAAESRGTAKVAYDGRGSTELRAGDFVEVCESPHPFALRVS